MRISPVAQNNWFLTKKIMILLPAAGKRSPRRLCLVCCNPLGQTFNCANPRKIIHFALFFGPPCCKTNDSAFPTFTPPLFLPVAHARATLANWPPGKVLPVPEKQHFFQFSSNGFPKSPPPWPQKYPAYLFKRSFLILARGRSWRWPRKISLDFGFFGQPSC